jgi:hypothetical protein
MVMFVSEKGLGREVDQRVLLPEAGGFSEE